MGKLISDFVEKQPHTLKNACFDLMAVIANQVVFLKNLQFTINKPSIETNLFIMLFKLAQLVKFVLTLI